MDEIVTEDRGGGRSDMHIRGDKVTVEQRGLRGRGRRRLDGVWLRFI